MEDPGHLAVGAHVEGRELQGDDKVGAGLAEVEHPPLIGLAQHLVLVAPPEGDADRLHLVAEREKGGRESLRVIGGSATAHEQVLSGRDHDLHCGWRGHYGIN